MYLAVILDAFSRRVVGWALDRTLEAVLVVTVLCRALQARQPVPGLVHHSNRGVQYACEDYTQTLHHHGITISMNRKGNPYDNAACESFMKTLKYEEVYRQEYRDLAEAWASVGEFLNHTYNHTHLHSALGYRPPVELEQTHSRLQKRRGQLRMRFVRHSGIYRSDMSSHLVNPAPGSRFPVGPVPG